MLQFAKEIGAIHGGRPDWYAVAELLAETFAPQLLKDGPSSRPAHRPQKENWFWLVHDVELIVRQRGCTVKEACRRLAKGEKPHLVRITVGPGDRRQAQIQSGKWKGTKPRTLEQRYYEWLRSWKKESDERSLKIIDYGNSGALLP
jgi:hypothetical protein